MRTLCIIVLIFISFACLSQNNDLNTDNNTLSVNTGNLGNMQLYDQNKTPQIALSQMPQQPQSDNFQIVINSRIRTWGGTSGYSGKTVSVHQNKNVQKKSKHNSFSLFDKLFAKKFKKVHHYNKKVRIKKCAAF